MTNTTIGCNVRPGVEYYHRTELMRSRKRPEERQCIYREWTDEKQFKYSFKSSFLKSFSTYLIRSASLWVYCQAVVIIEELKRERTKANNLTKQRKEEI